MFQLTLARWGELRRVNAEVNTSYAPCDDQVQYGTPDFWQAIGLTGRGDCEDYALEKRERLKALSWPDEALRLAICDDAAGARHCVLTVDTDRGTYVLDNLCSDVEPWRDLPYRWLCRQAVSGWRWVAID